MSKPVNEANGPPDSTSARGEPEATMGRRRQSQQYNTADYDMSQFCTPHNHLFPDPHNPQRFASNGHGSLMVANHYRIMKEIAEEEERQWRLQFQPAPGTAEYDRWLARLGAEGPRGGFAAAIPKGKTPQERALELRQKTQRMKMA